MVVDITGNVKDLIDEVYRRSINARSVLRKHIHKTPLVSNRTLSILSGGEVYLKLENMQKTGAFKVRGALYKIHRLLLAQNIKGVVAASSGNHAQGVAYAARCYGIESYIVMPRTASATKINATKSYGAKVVLYGEYYDEAYEKAMMIKEEKGYPFIHPYDDLDVIAGQATIAHEILEELPSVDYILAPIGGGGLLAGIAVVAKKRNSRIKVIGIEPRNAPSMYSLIRHQKRLVEVKPSIADAVVVKNPGKITSEIIRELADDIILVDEDDISHAIAFLLERAKIVVEGAGALPVAAILSGSLNLENARVVAVVSGGNIDPILLSRIIVHEASRDGRVLSIIGEVYDKPGELKKVIEVLARHGLNIVDIRHDRWDPSILPNRAIVEIVLEAKDKESIGRALSELGSRGYVFHTRGDSISRENE